MIQNYQDAMAICSWAGYPDIFLTYTCNPMWPEITRHCEKDGLKPCDKPEILSRVFHMKLDKLMRILKDENILGSIKADVYTVEFQKRGLSHAHIILWLFEADKLTSPFDVDQLISIEIPDKLVDPELYELVRSYMVHGPCGRSSRNVPCMEDGKCSKYFPKRYNAHTILDEKGYPTYRRRNDGRTVSRKGVKLDNKFVVPYNARLLKLFCVHLNIEKTNQSRAIKYLFKYISKGNDRVIASIYNNNDSLGSQQSFDEVSHYLNCRIGHCTPAQGELYYLRLLLTKVRGAKTYTDIRTVNTVVYPTFREACYALGLLDDDKEYIDAIKEASSWASGNYLHQFFTSMLLSHCLSQPAIVWEHTKGFLCEDLLHISHGDNRFPDLHISSADKEAAGLSIIEKLLLRNGRSLNDYPSLPTPDTNNIFDISNQLILQELNYNKLKEREESERLQRLMIAEQKQVFDEIMGAASSKKEYLNAIKCSGFPHHKLVLKIGVPVMLIRNIDQATGLCNGTRLQITQLGKNVVKAKALNETSAGEEILIHKMNMNPSETTLPFKMTRRQFPIIISFAMTINKSQGQSLSNAGLYLPSPIFSHGQLYVAMSRVKNFSRLKILILNEFGKCSNITINVVYREVFQNLLFH
ncbi:hypothetical protein K1719_013355 [Acacia pycnantha]|nr:hypothetical protein K1719_013355 [Acacia pycnantha]